MALGRSESYVGHGRGTQTRVRKWLQGWAPVAAGTCVARVLGAGMTGDPAMLAMGCVEDIEVMPRKGRRIINHPENAQLQKGGRSKNGHHDGLDLTPQVKIFIITKFKPARIIQVFSKCSIVIMYNQHTSSYTRMLLGCFNLFQLNFSIFKRKKCEAVQVPF